MKRWFALFVGVMLSFGAFAQPARTYTPAELDSMLAPIALYPDPLLTNILTASLTPFDVKAAADWSAANPNLTGDAALQAVEGELWHPSVKALVAYPDVLARMGENMQWVTDLGQAYQNQYPQLSASIQGLRSRAQNKGALRSDEQQTVYQQNDAIYVQPVQPNVVYAPYYDPYVVYGAWWWPGIYPVVWRPWVAYPVYVTRIVAPVRIAYPGHHVWHPSYAMPHPAVRQPVGQVRPLSSPMPSPRAVSPRAQQWQPQPQQQRPQQWQQSRPSSYPAQPYHAVPESRRAPVVQSHTAPVARTPPTPLPRGNAYANGHSQMRGNGGGNSGHAFTGGSSGRSFGGGGHGGGGRRG